MDDWKERLLIKREQLRVKLAANEQRVFRQSYLAELPERLGTYLEGCPFLHSPELDSIRRMFFVYPDGIARPESEAEGERFKPEGYTYGEMSWPDQLLETALRVSEQHDHEDAFFYPFDGPLYEVPFGWVRTNLAALFACKSRIQEHGARERWCPERLGVITRDFKAGIVLDNYAGYLEEDPNPNETVYQLAMWGFQESTFRVEEH